MPALRDLYAVLGVPRTADQDEIQRAYRKLARTYHPDVNPDPDAADRFKEISAAYDVLSDPETRRRYDAFGPDFRRVPEGVDPDTWARGRGGRPAADGDGVRFGADDVDFGDLFGDLFSRAGRGSARWSGWGPVPGADQEAELAVSVEEAYRGGQRSLTIGGAGGERTVQVTIPAGVTDGQRIRLAGQGGPGAEGAADGDLYLRIRIAPHLRYRVQGRDLHTTLPLTPWEAALGTTVAIDTPGGEAKVTVPPGTSSGRRLRLRGRGLPNPRGPAGDLYAEARIVVPPRLSAEERRLFSELAAVSMFDPRKSR
jgi:curved DNA-binding protein